MLNEKDTISFYSSSDLIRVPQKEAFSELVSRGSFEVFLSFNDPRTDFLIEDRFTFYPKEQIGPNGRCFLAEYQGLVIRIPSDMGWWQKNSGSALVPVPQKTWVLKEGEFIMVKFNIDVLASIRIS